MKLLAPRIGALLALLASPGRGDTGLPATTRSLETDRPWQGTLGSRERHVWHIQLGKGQHAAVEIAADLPGLHVRLLDETGQEALARDQAPGAEVISWVSAAAGRWTVELTPLPLPDPVPSDYLIWLPVLRDGTEADRGRWARDLLAAELARRLEGERPETAKEILPRWLEAAGRTLADDPRGLASHLETLGERFATSCYGPAAADLMKRALAVRERAQGADHLEVAQSLNRLATIHFFLGEWDLVESAERRALDIRRQHFFTRQTAESYRDLGSLYYFEGRYGEAVDALQRALDLFERERPPSRADLAETRNYLAEVYRARGDLRQAQAAFDRASDEARGEQERAPQVYGLLLINRAGLKRDQGRYAEARSDLKQALEIFSRIDGYSSDLATATMNLADLDRMAGNLEEAEKGLRQALELAEQALCPGDPNLLWFLNQYAMTLAEQDRHAEAEPQYRRALDVAEAALGPDHLGTVQSLHDLAGTLAALGRHAEADELSRRALAIREKVFRQDHPEVAASLVQRARLALLGTGKASDASLAAVERAIGILERPPRIYPEHAIDAYELHADLLRKRGDAAAARRALARALELVETQRLRAGGGDRTRSHFLRLHLPLYDRMVEWQIEAGDLGTALFWTERSRARVLQDQLAAAGMDLFGGGRLAALELKRAEARSRMAEIHQQLSFARSRSDTGEEDRSSRIAALEAGLDQAYRDYEGAIEEMKDESPRWRGVDGPAARPEEIQALAPGDGALLLYRIGKERSHLFLVAPSGAPEAHLLKVSADAAVALGVPEGPLTSAKAREIFSRKGSLSAAEASRRRYALWKVLVPGDLWARIRPAGEVVLVPDRWLHGLPFEQLVVEPGAGPGQETYWLDQGPPIRYAPSASSLHTLGELRGIADDSTTPPVLSVADPVYDPADLGNPPAAGHEDRLSREEKERPLERLPRTADETRAILRVFEEVYGEAGADVQTLVREHATEAAVRSTLPGRRFVHLGTHGIVREGNEHSAGLALAPPHSGSWPAEDDGFLQLFEIYDLRLNADLAVLSACETHAGGAIEGEGVFSLSRGFLAAGVRRVVASLWRVEEESTAALMESFFRRVLADYRAGRPIRYSAALRDAKRDLRARPEWSSPFFWAPFVLTGIE